jgi:glycosyltransferase involved in cell wall biosynthesis
MKVLHVISGDLWAGAESQALTLLTNLAGFENMALAAVLLNEGRLAQELRRAGIRVTVLPERELGTFALLNGLRSEMQAWGPDVVHTHREKENVLGSLANRLAGRAACVRTVHGLPEPGMEGSQGARRGVIESLDKVCARYLQDAVICVSDELRAHLAGMYPGQLVVAVTNGIDAAAIARETTPLEFLPRQPQIRHIGIAGRLEPVKRVDLFIDMAALLVRRQPDVGLRFHVFGEGSLGERLREQSRGHGLEAVVTFHGNRNDITSCIAALDVIVLCSDHEGLPMVALEALAVRTPLVAHAVGGLPGLVRETGGGTLVTNHTPEVYADAVMEIIRGGGARARSNVTWPTRLHAKHNAEQIIQVYSRVLRPR